LRRENLLRIEQGIPTTNLAEAIVSRGSETWGLRKRAMNGVSAECERTAVCLKMTSPQEANPTKITPLK
jgi:hypothetical protein